MSWMVSGWPAIEEATGRGKKALKRLARERGFPIVHFGNKPSLTRKALEKWYDEQLAAKKQKK